jgi:protoporphyrinogen/coproporphyrinogen III oxidase
VTDVEVAVVGGGLSGLFTAVSLVGSGRGDVVVLEGSELPGGVARTIERDGYALEPGVGSMSLPHPHLSPLLGEMAAEVVPVDPAATLRLVHTGGRKVELPASPRALLAPLVPPAAKLRGALEPFVRRGGAGEDEALESFLTRRFGRRLGETMAWLTAAGVHAGDPRRLSAKAAFPALVRLEEQAGSVIRGGLARRRARPEGVESPRLHVPVRGTAGVADAAAARLGDRFRSRFGVRSVRRGAAGWIVEGPERLHARHVVLACRPTAAARLVGGDLAAVLGRASAAPVAVVALGGVAEALPLPKAFGMLTGPDSGMASLGFLFESSYAPGRAPDGRSLVKVIAGGATRPEVAEWDDDRLVRRVGEDLARALGSDVAASFTGIVRHREGIPQYEVGHCRWLAEIGSALDRLPGLHVTGWGYRGVGVGHIAGDAVRIAGRIATGASGE